MVHLFTTELFLLFSSFFILGFFFAKYKLNLVSIYLSNMFISFSLFLSFLISFFSIFLYSSDPFLISVNNYFIITTGLLEFKSLILFFNFCFFFNFSDKIFYKKNTEIFFFYILFYLFSTLLVLSINHLFLLFLAIEIQNFLTYLLITTFKNKQTTLKSVFMYLILNSILAIFFLCALILLYSLLKTLIISDITALRTIAYDSILALPLERLVNSAFILLFLIISFKLASAPFHFWIKDVYSGISVTLIGFFNMNSKLVLFFILIKIFFILNIRIFDISFLFIFLGTCSLIIGVLLTLYQRTIKTFLICSSIVHVGYLFLAIGHINSLTFSLPSLFGYLFHYILILFFIWRILMFFQESTLHNDFFLTELPFFFKYVPFLGFIFCCSLISLAGLPPFIGFFFKFQILLAILVNTSWSFLFFCLFISVISAYYYLNLIKLIFFEKLSIQKIKMTRILYIIRDDSFLWPFILTCFCFFLLSPFYFDVIYIILYNIILTLFG